MPPTQFANTRREKHALGVGAGAGAIAGLTAGTTLSPLGALLATIVGLGALGLGVYSRVGDSTVSRQLQQEPHYVFAALTATLLATLLLRHFL